MGNTTSKHHSILPPELVAEIFDYACESYREYVREAMDRMKRRTSPGNLMVIQHRKEEHVVTPGTISLVCKDWKNIVYDTPMLWDTIYVDMKDSAKDGFALSHATHKFRGWLQRAGTCSLTVKIEGAEHLQEQLLAYTRQWKNIDICCPGNHPEIYLRLETLIKQPPNSLETFIYRPSSHCSFYGNYAARRAHPVLSVEATPKLTRAVKFGPLRTNITPLAHIKEFKWSDSEAQVSILRDLQYMENLRECSMYSTWSTFDGLNLYRTADMPVIRLPYLENLNIHDIRGTAITYVLNRLEVPSLRRFSFSNSSEHRGPPPPEMNVVQEISSFLLRRNSPNILSLDLNIAPSSFVTGDIIYILKTTFASLEHFSFTLSGFGEYAANILAGQSGTVEPVPITLNNLSSYYVNLACLQECENKKIDSTSLFTHLSLPALKKFQIVLPSQKKAFTVIHTAALDLLYRSNSPLTMLKINTIHDISKTKLLNLLKLLPSLECLHLIGQNFYSPSHPDQKARVKFKITNDIFEFLLPQPQIYLPRLTELSCEGTLEAKKDVILTALEYRWIGDEERGMAKLSRFRLYSSQIGNVMADHRYWELVRQGMDIKINKPSRIEYGMEPVRY